MPTPNFPKHTLSKSTFMRGCQCVKSLWLHKHNPELRTEVNEQQEAIFLQGQNVGEAARSLFPGGVDASPPTPFEYQKSVALTGQLISSGAKVIYEACFQFNEVLAALDILVCKKGKWYAYEVKSSTEIKPQYIIDSALQYHVMTNAGIELEDFSIVYIDNSYVRKEELDVKKLFHIESIYEQVLTQQDFIKSKIEELKKVVKSPKQPTQDIGGHCSDPYPCDFMGHCWKHIPKNSVFELRGKGASEAAFELYKQGVLELKKVPDDY